MHIEFSQVRQYALQVLQMSKRFLQEDRTLQPVAFIVVGREPVQRRLDFSTPQRKDESCSGLVAEARGLGATAIVVVFTAKASTRRDLTRGKGQNETVQKERAILVAVSGPTFPNFLIEAPFEEQDGRITFLPDEEHRNVKLDILENWEGKADP